MKLFIAGGCGEHGRNCFMLEGDTTALLVDCGLMAGEADPYPRLSDAQIGKLRWLFLTHSHQDHTGAYPWLAAHGFSGQVVMTRETAGQVSFALPQTVFIDQLVPPGTPHPLGDGLSVCWGKTGHCAGSVWYRIQLDGKTVLFSGDYVEDTLVYACDPIRGQAADLALLDSAYGGAKETPEACRRALLERAGALLAQGKAVLLPVPKYGRGLELAFLLRRKFPEAPLWMDAFLRGETARLDALSPWLKPVLPELKKLGACHMRPQSGFMLTADPQLKAPEARALAKEILARGGAVVLTGNTDSGSYSRELLSSGRAELARYPVHMNDAGRLALEKQNRFVRCIPVHCDQHTAPETTEF